MTSQTICIVCGNEFTRSRGNQCKSCIAQYMRDWRAARKARGLPTQNFVRDPIKRRASAAVQKRIESGKIKRQPCEVCGATNSQAHHDDYSRPLDVTWLCPQHHADVHRESRSTSTTSA